MAWRNIKTYYKDAYGANSFDKNLLEEWLRDKNITKWTTQGACDIPRFLKTGRNNMGYKNIMENKPPYIDHVVYFKSTDPLKVWLVYHPYHDTKFISKDIKEWVDANNLIVTLYDSNKSWYSKGNTSMVVITTP